MKTCCEHNRVESKHCWLLLLFMLCFAFAGQAQVDPHALGVRLHAGTLNGMELSYQHGLTHETRFEINVGYGFGLNSDRLIFTGTYQWVYELTDQLGWYAGPGASVGFYSLRGNANHSSQIFIGAAGLAGLQYRLDVPLQLTADFRPVVQVIPNIALQAGVGLGIRYTFGL